jgi:CheY-like chemotaxis protein
MIKHIPKILLVEDNPTIQTFHTYMLKKLGYEVVLAKTGQEALTLFSQQAYFAILMDVGLPDMLGTEVTALIQKDAQYLNTPIPIIIATAYSEYDIIAECKALQINAMVINKPITCEKFKALYFPTLPF